MRKNWIGTVVLVGVSMTAGLLLSQMWEQVLGQPGGFFVETPSPQVVVNQQTELPKCYVDFVTLPIQGETLPRIRVITVVDTELKRIAVYHMEMATGRLWWLSTRDIQPELKVNQFNATSPLPSEISREIQRLEEKNR